MFAAEASDTLLFMSNIKYQEKFNRKPRYTKKHEPRVCCQNYMFVLTVSYCELLAERWTGAARNDC
jgi:hypothetical protein